MVITLQVTVDITEATATGINTEVITDITVTDIMAVGTTGARKDTVRMDTVRTVGTSPAMPVATMDLIIPSTVVTPAGVTIRVAVTKRSGTTTRPGVTNTTMPITAHTTDLIITVDTLRITPNTAMDRTDTTITAHTVTMADTTRQDTVDTMDHMDHINTAVVIMPTSIGQATKN